MLVANCSALALRWQAPPPRLRGRAERHACAQRVRCDASAGEDGASVGGHKCATLSQQDAAVRFFETQLPPEQRLLDDAFAVHLVRSPPSLRLACPD
jgi:hypothetical protein